MVSFITQVCHGEKNYRIRAQFDNYDDFLEAEEKIREIMDRKRKLIRRKVMSDFMMETKDFLDGYIYQDSIGLLITLCPRRWYTNDVYSIQRLVLWQDLYRMPLKCRNMAMLCLLEALSNEYEFLNGKKGSYYKKSRLVEEKDGNQDKDI